MPIQARGTYTLCLPCQSLSVFQTESFLVRVDFPHCPSSTTILPCSGLDRLSFRACHWCTSDIVLLGQTVRQKDGELPADHPRQAAKRKPSWVYNPPDQIMTASKRAGGIFLHSGDKFHLSCAAGEVGL